MAELLTANERTAETAVGWTTWINTPARATDQFKSGVASHKIGPLAGAGGVVLPGRVIPTAARRLSFSTWIRATRIQTFVLYLRQYNGGVYIDLTATVQIAAANTWQHLEYPVGVPTTYNGLLMTHFICYMYFNVAASPDEIWWDDSSLTDDTDELRLKTWNGTAWVPRRSRVF